MTPITKINDDSLSYDEKLERIQRYLPRGITEKILSQREKIEGERRQVTIMFCDMTDSMPLNEKLGPEESYDIMDQVYEILIHKVHEYEGTVNEMRGDGILALFGAPIALEDAPQRALRSALAIQHEMRKFNEINRDNKIPPILLRIGINSGPVVVGAVGNDLRVQFTAVGDTVNMAARMEKLAEPGTTFLAEETFKLTKELFQFEDLGEKKIKGKKKPVPVYKLISAKEDIFRPRLGSERRIYSEMVGRDRDLDKLELQVMKAINGEGSVVNIIGEAGIGKSRLIAELKKREVMNRVTLLEGRAISIGRNLSFHPIVDLLKKWACIRHDDGEATALGKLEVAVRKVCSEDVYEILPFVATLMGMKPSGRYAERIKGIEGEPLEKLILKNLRDLLIRAAESNPIVIVAEDLHWADTSSIQLMESLFRLAETQRILFINLFRSDHIDTGDRLIETLKERLPVYYVEIRLDPLNEQKSEALINNMLNTSGLYHTVIGQIIQRAGGNPFFIEEVVRSLIDEGAVVQKDGTFQVTEKIGTVAIPKTINDVLMARIDRLEPQTLELVKVASVVGSSFFYRILSEVAMTVDELEAKLYYLQEIQLVRKHKRMGELEYIFKHALTQEAVYDSILPKQRKKLHLQVASSIERIFAEGLHEFYGMLAYHYSRAENMEKAEEYLLKAGEDALKTSASNEALHYYQEALEIYLNKYDASTDPEKVAMIEKNIALAYYNRGHYDESIEHFDKALDYYWGALPKNYISVVFTFLFEFTHFLVWLYFPFLKFKKAPSTHDIEAVNLFFKKLKVLAIINPMRYFFESFHFYKRAANFDLTKFELGIGLFVGASTIFSFTGISFMLSRKILNLFRDRVDKNDIKSFIIYDFSETMHNYFKGNWDSIKAYDDDLVRKNLNNGELFWTSQHFFWHGCPKHYQGCFDVTRKLVDKLNNISEVFENDIAMLLKYLLNTNLLMECGKWQDALVEIEKGVEFGQKISQGSILFEMYSRKAHILILMGNIEEAGKSLKLADGVRREINTVPWQLSDFSKSQFEYDIYKLKKSLEAGDKRKISEYRKKSKKSAKKMLRIAQKVAQNRTETYKLFGVYYWLINKQKKAFKWWQKSISEGERLGARLELSRTYFEVGKCLLEDTCKYKGEMFDRERSEEYLGKARVLFAEMDLQWDLDELDRVYRG